MRDPFRLKTTKSCSSESSCCSVSFHVPKFWIRTLYKILLVTAIQEILSGSSHRCMDLMDSLSRIRDWALGICRKLVAERRWNWLWLLLRILRQMLREFSHSMAELMERWWKRYLSPSFTISVQGPKHVFQVEQHRHNCKLDLSLRSCAKISSMRSLHASFPVQDF